MQLTEQQLAIALAVRDGKGNIAVNAGAGSGKTSTAIAVISDYIPKTDSVLYCAFNRKIKQETERKFSALRDRIGANGYSNASAKTFNGIAYGAFMKRKGINSSSIEMNEQKYLKLAKRWCDEHMSYLLPDDRDLAAEMINDIIHYARVNTTYDVTGSRNIVVLTGSREDGSPHYIPLEAPYFFGNHNDVHILREIAWKYDIFGQLDKDEDEERLLRAIPELLADGKTQMDQQYLCTFTDQVYWMVIERWQVWKNKWVIVDEAQDLSPLFRALVDNCFDAYKGGRVLVIGDPCQPEGTLVSMADGSQKQIECLVEGDKVVSYNSRDNAFRKAGRVVTGITKRPFSGNLVTVETENGLRSEYTPNHHCYANFSPLRNKYAVYMMRKGDYYRIGIARMDYKSERLGCGVIRRMRDEQADAAWILAVYDTREEAFVMEEAISGKFGVPQLRFVDAANSVVMNNTRIAQAWQWIGENYERAQVCLEYFGREINFPLVINEPGKYLSLKRPMIVHASNLMDGVLMLPYTGHTHPKSIALDSAWRPIKIGRREYNGFVYSLNVEIDHLYIADNLVTHNCQAIYAFTGADNDGFDNSMRFWNIEKAFPLTISWRCPVKVAELARTWKTDFQAAPNAIEGVVGDTSEEALVRDAQPGDAIISRTRGPMIPIWQKLVANGKAAIIIGSDVSKAIIKVLEHVSKSGNFKFEELPVHLREYKDQKLTRMRKKDKPQDEIDRFLDQMEAVNGAVEAVQASSMDELIRKIKDIFAKNDEEIDESNAVMIMTGHASKGLEFNRVYMLTPTLFPFNHPGQSPEQAVQEMNLRYVVQTRAMKELLHVRSKKETPKKEDPKPVVEDDVVEGEIVTDEPVALLTTGAKALESAIAELDAAVGKLLEAPKVTLSDSEPLRVEVVNPQYDEALVTGLIEACLDWRSGTGHPITMMNRLKELAKLAEDVKRSGDKSSQKTVDSVVRVV
jgi:superfamily I DNA/RNA helicase